MQPDGLVSARDGIRLAYWTRGGGPLLILVHGSGTDHRCFEQVVERLTEYRVVAYDRRGHGRSGGTAPQNIDTEIDDLLAVLDHAARPDQPAFLLGYSYGALVSLHALLTRTTSVRAAVLYEPPMHEPGMLPQAAEVVRLIDSGEDEAALSLFVSSTFHLPDRVVARMRQSAPWQVSLELVSTLPAEFTAVRDAVLPEPTVPVPPIRVLVAAEGGNPAFVRVADRIQRVVPGAEVVRVPGLPHFAVDTAPDAFVDVVRNGLARSPA